MESVPSSTLRSPGLDALLVQSPNFPTLEALPISSFLPDYSLIEHPEVETEEGKAGVYKELALFELFLRDSSRNSRNRQVVRLFCVYLSWRKLYLELQ